MPEIRGTEQSLTRSAASVVSNPKIPSIEPLLSRYAPGFLGRWVSTFMPLSVLRVPGRCTRAAALAARALVADARRLAGRGRVRYPGPGARARHARLPRGDGRGRIVNREAPAAEAVGG